MYYSLVPLGLGIILYVITHKKIFIIAGFGITFIAIGYLQYGIKDAAILGALYLIILLFLISRQRKRQREWEQHRAYYDATDYARSTGRTMEETENDLGKNGEYYLSQLLETLPGYKRLLYNCYLPKEDGTTTETDIIMLHETGIYIFESKNYSGWIFGSENDKNWTQTLSLGRNGVQKNHFYNPIWQNNNHIKYLKRLLIGHSNLPYYSFVVFGPNAVLKKIQIIHSRNNVVTTNNLLETLHSYIEKEVILTTEEIEAIYLILSSFSHVDERWQQEHIQQVLREPYHQ